MKYLAIGLLLIAPLLLLDILDNFQLICNRINALLRKLQARR